MRGYLEDWYEMFPDLVVEPAELIDVGPERVIVVWHVAGTAEQSGVPTELRLSIVYTIRDGRIVHSREYQTKDEALAAEGAGAITPVVLDVTDAELVAALPDAFRAAWTGSSTTPASWCPDRSRRSRSTTCAASSRSTSSVRWR